MSQSQRTRAGTGTATRRPSPTLVVVILGCLVLPMSMSGAGVAVPLIAADLDAPGAPAQWVVTAYFLTASSFMLVAGSLGDIVGRRKVFRVGAIVYAVGSLGAALAPSIGVLLAARALTGLGAAGVLASGAALLAGAFEGSARTRAFATMGTTAGIGLALGPALSGWIVGSAGWRVSFGIFTVAGLVVAAGAAMITESRARHRTSVDWAGAIALVASLALLMLGLSQGGGSRWGHPLTAVPLLAGGLLLVVFVMIERRADTPLLEMALLRNRRFMGWLLALVALALGFGGILAYLPTYLQTAAEHSPVTAGWAMLLPTLPMLIMPLAAGRLVDRGIRPPLLINVALLLIGAGDIWLMILHPGVGLGEIAGPLLAVGAGVGLASGIIDAQALGQVDPRYTGMASGTINTVRSASNTVVLALFGSALLSALGISLGSSELAGRAASGTWLRADHTVMASHLTDAWRIVLGASGGIVLLMSVLVHRLVRTSDTGARTWRR